MPICTSESMRITMIVMTASERFMSAPKEKESGTMDVLKYFGFILPNN